MYFIRKLKPDRSITGLIPAIIYTIIFVVTLIFFDLQTATFVLAVLFWIYALFSFSSYLQTRNTGFVVATLFQIFVGLFLAAVSGKVYASEVKLARVFLVCYLVFSLWLAYLILTKRIKWRGREIFELAAASVDEIANGFTARPHPAGKIDGSKRVIMGFADFASQNLLAMAYVEENKVVLLPVMMGDEFAFLLGLRKNYQNESWISFDFEGNVSVNISQKDYLNYREDLSFDQLCESLGNLFMEFLELFKRGEGVRIIDRMNALNISIFS
jgi:hypothetical protein